MKIKTTAASTAATKRNLSSKSYTSHRLLSITDNQQNPCNEPSSDEESSNSMQRYIK